RVGLGRMEGLHASPDQHDQLGREPAAGTGYQLRVVSRGSLKQRAVGARLTGDRRGSGGMSPASAARETIRAIPCPYRFRWTWAPTFCYRRSAAFESVRCAILSCLAAFEHLPVHDDVDPRLHDLYGRDGHADVEDRVGALEARRCK